MARCVAFFVKVNAPEGYQMETITVRDATRADAAAIIAFQQAMARETEGIELDGPTVTRGVQGVFEDPSRGRYFVACRGDEIVASLMITFEWSDWRNGTVWWIQSVYVTPDVRKQRVYGRLYEHVKQLVQREPDVRGIRLYVDRRNTVAQQVYTRLGMNGEHYQVFEWMKEF